MNINYDGLEQEQRIRKIATSLVSNEQLIKMQTETVDGIRISQIKQDTTPNQQPQFALSEGKKGGND